MDEKTLKAQRNSLLGFLVLLSFCSGWLSVVSDNEAVFFSISIANAVSVTLFIITLSQIRNRPLKRSFHWLIYFSWPVVFPIYIIRSYKWMGLVFLVGVVLTYFISMTSGYYLALSLFG